MLISCLLMCKINTITVSLVLSWIAFMKNVFDLSQESIISEPALMSPGLVVSPGSRESSRVCDPYELIREHSRPFH